MSRRLMILTAAARFCDYCDLKIKCITNHWNSRAASNSVSLWHVR